MKKYLLSTFVALSVVVGFNGVMAEDHMHGGRTYGVVQAGYGFGHDNYKGHGIVGVGLGYKFDQYFRSDVIVGYRGWGKTKFNGATEKSDTWAMPVLANLYATMPFYHNMDAYIMGGIGYAHNKTDTTADGKGKGSDRFAWNIGAGIDFMTNDCWTFDLGYRYTDLGKARLSGTAAGVGSNSKLKSHDVVLSARYNF